MTQTDDITYPVMCIIANTHDMTDQDYKKYYLKWRRSSLASSDISGSAG